MKLKAGWFTVILSTAIAIFCGSFSAHAAQAILANSSSKTGIALIEQGEYVARAADCMACHRTTAKNGPLFAGGYVIASPIGNMIASNITPSEHEGIGRYSEQQFADALRKGITPEGKYLYPAMPYTAYQGMSDEDIHALYTYLMSGVKPVDTHVQPTVLRFPFNVRQLMFIWNRLFLKEDNDAETTSLPATDPQFKRGKYLVNNLAHCGTCHTPRDAMMAEDNTRYLSGAALNGWKAPNITSDKISGVGGWSQKELVQFLRTGHVLNKAQAAGSMADAVEHSFRYLHDDDLNAIAAYIKTVPAIRDPQQAKVAYGVMPLTPVDISQLESGQGDQKSLADASTQNGARLYNAACASCHGINGQGTADNFYPSLTQNSAVGGTTANNLVMVILQGIHRQSADADVSMPAFEHQLTSAQVAAIANYVTQQFGDKKWDIRAKDIDNWRQGGESSWLLMAVPYLFWCISLLIILLIVLMRFKWQHTKKRHKNN